MQIENEKVRELVQALDLTDEDVYAQYSGRGMYGRTCFGLVIEGNDFLTVGVAMRDVFGEDAWDIARSARFDSLGMRSIVYFPGWELEDASEFEEEYEDA